MDTKTAIKWGGGTQKRLADRLGCSQSTVAEWGDFPPPVQQLRIQILSRGRLRAEPTAINPKARR